MDVAAILDFCYNVLYNKQVLPEAELVSRQQTSRKLCEHH